MQDLTIITKSILASTSDPTEIVEMAYQLGVTHGKAEATCARARPIAKRRVYEDARRNISLIAKCRSKSESQWLEYLITHFWKVSHEPKKFTVLIDGKYTSYTPDFQCVREDGTEIWIESKCKSWLKIFNSGRVTKDYRQLRCMQECVARHKIHLYIVAGKPPPGKSEKLQVLGLECIQADHPSTLVPATHILANGRSLV